MLFLLRKSADYNIPKSVRQLACKLKMYAELIGDYEKQRIKSHCDNILNYENDAALGLSCTETTRNAAANKLYGKSFKDLSESQKQLTLLKMVEDANAASGALGQAARESNTWTNQMGNLKQSWTDFQATLGEPVLEYVTSAVGWLAEKVGGLTQKFSGAGNPVQKFVNKLKALKPWFEYISGHISNTLSPILSDLGAVFKTVKDAVQPLIDAFVEYCTNGQLKIDITNAILYALGLVSTAYGTVKDLILGIVQGFKDAVTWGQEHQTALQYIAIALGTVTAAIAAYNIAMAIKNAGGIVELAQLGATAIGYYALTAAETAHTIATTVATAATSAFGAVLAFITSPITLVVLAIGALVAAGVALYQNWDVVKEKALQLWEWLGGVWEGIKNVAITCWDNIKLEVGNIINALWTIITTIWNNIKTTTSNIWDGIKNVVSTCWTNIKTEVGNAINAVWTVISSIWNSIKTTTSNIWDGIKASISSVWDGIKSKVTNVTTAVWTAVAGVWSSLQTTTTTVWEDIKSSITEKITAAKDTVKGIIDSIVGFFTGAKFTWPKIPMPHFGISPQGWEIGDLLKGSIPTLSVAWYAKAMENPIIMDKPTVFGYDPASGQLMAGGEAGSEVVSGTDTLLNMIGSVVAANSAAQGERLAALLEALLEIISGGNQEIIQALRSGQTIVLNNREFARAVREYA